MLEFLTLKPDAFGLDITDTSLKITNFKRKGKFLKLTSYLKEEIKPGVIEEGEVKDEDSLVKAVKESIRKVKGEKLLTNYVIASLPEEKAFLEVIQMPKLKEEELKEAVYFEAENYIPLPINEVYLDFQIVQPVFNHLDHTDILIAALPRKTIDPYVAVLAKAGLHPKVLEIESLAVCRAIIKNEISSHPLLLIDLGANRTGFMIFSGYSLRFTSVLPISARQFTQAISQVLKVSFQEAEELKIKYGLEKRYRMKIQDGTEREIEPGKIFEILLPGLDNLVSQIKKYLDYYQTHITHEHLPPDGKGIKKVLLCGGGANLKGITEFLSIQLRTPVELANPWTNILEIPFKELPELSYEKSLEYTTALGLALRGVKEK
jgi:type IV pilus assembly protein PilM